jgi:hypothetical protein
MQGINPMMMQQQMPPGIPQGQQFNKGGPQHHQQYRQKQPAGGMGQ